MSRGFLFILIAATLASSAEAVAGSPGALPVNTRAYADAYRGWPVAPRHRQHPVRGSFLDARYPAREFHWGIDINVRDDRPERGAPRGRTHRVYAVESGVVGGVLDGRGIPCVRRRLSAGHFSYWHVDATVRPGAYVRAGQHIGWTCAGAWHVHLGEWALVAGTPVWVNPLRPGGKIGPYEDRAVPRIRQLSFHAPAMPPAFGRRLDPTRLEGVVDLSAWIGDPQSHVGWFVGRFWKLQTEHHPYEVAVRMRHEATGRTWRWIVFRSDVWLSARLRVTGTPIPFRHHFAPGSRGNLKIPRCLRRLEQAADPEKVDCAGRYRLRLFATRSRAFWDTRRFPNGRYRFHVVARDQRGNSTAAAVFANVRN